MWTVIFWILVVLLANSALGTLKAAFNREWYEDTAYANGAKPDFNRLIIIKTVTIGAGLFVLYWIGTQIGYFS